MFTLIPAGHFTLTNHLAARRTRFLLFSTFRTELLLRLDLPAACSTMVDDLLFHEGPLTRLDTRNLRQEENLRKGKTLPA